MIPREALGYIPEFYDAEVVIPRDKIRHIQTETDFQLLRQHLAIDPREKPPLRVTPVYNRYTIQAAGFKVRIVPGKELKKLLDLGYTEAQGKLMLEASKPVPLDDGEE